MKKLTVWASVLLLITICSCNVRDEDVVDRDPEDGLQASSLFDWSTTQMVQIDITGLELPVEISRKLSLSTEDGNVFYAGTHKMNDSFHLQVELPNHIQSVTMKYGAIEKSQNLTSSKLLFNYEPNISEGNEQ